MPTAMANRITLVSRIFTLVAVGAPVLWYRDTAALVALLVVTVVWLVAVVDERRDQPLLVVSPAIEAAAVGVVCGITIERSEAILLALTLPPFIAAVLRGLRGTLLALAVELAAAVAFALLWQGTLTEEQGFALFAWGMAGLGFGLIGSFVYATAQDEVDELTPYRDAQRLIRQLIDLSDDLSAGLEVTSLAGSVLGEVGDVVPSEAFALYEPRDDVLVPLASRAHGSGEDLHGVEDLVRRSWSEQRPIVEERAFAFPVGTAAVLGGLISPEADLAPGDVETAIAEASPRWQATAVKLDTALLFSTFRDAASADVRSRLAREMHDGVAQDIASLGYLVDALAARPANDKQAQQFALLRDRITGIVAEVRQTVLTLRTSIGAAESLGTAIGAVARHLSESSRIPIQVTLDEQATRLRPEVEAELFRITQEAMNNAVKHARCDTIEVHCQVNAPDVRITVADDGRGLQQGRSDSHGLKIMRERARLVGADLTIDNRPEGGLVVAVQISTRAGARTLPVTAER